MQVDVEDLMLIANKLSSDSGFYKNKKIFITGGTGFFGKWLLETFIHLNTTQSLNVSVTILSRSPNIFEKGFPHLFNHDHFKFVQGDVRNFPDITGNFDLIIHAATDASVALNKSNPELMRNTIMDGAIRICRFAKDVNCKRILYTSSGAAYGPQPGNMAQMPESFVDNPNFDNTDAYASAKLESETYFKENSPCDVVIARCFAFAGPYLPLDGSYAFGNFIHDELNKRNIVIKSDGSAVRSYLYAADLVIWLMRILSLGQHGEVYNVGSTLAISIKELAKKISDMDVSILGHRDQNMKKRYIPSTEKSVVKLGLREHYTLDEMINKTKVFHQLIKIGKK